MYTFAISRIKEAVDTFYPEMYDVYCAKFRKTRTTSDIAYIFYDNPTTSPTELTRDQMYMGVYNDPQRYPLLRRLIREIEVDMAWKKYRDCIPKDVQNRGASALLRSLMDLTDVNYFSS